MALRRWTAGLALAAALALGACGQGGRDQIRIVGSSTLFPFSSAVAEQFAARGEFPTPIVEATGTGGGIKLFCAGVGLIHPDIANASRRMRKGEYADCQKAGVRDIVELKVGYDGIVFANARGGLTMDITKRQIYLALARDVPDGNGGFTPNPYKRWSDIDPALPDEPRAREIDQLAKLREDDEGAFRRRAGTLREDGAWNDAGENDNVLVQQLVRNPDAFGVFGYSFFEENRDRVQAAKVAGVEPTFETIASGDYRIARDLFIYLKRQHVGVVPGIQEFASEFVSTRASGARGYLKGRGMVPLPEAERVREAAVAAALTPMAPPER
jgi:phosphate transport system substrate-binding protein